MKPICLEGPLQWHGTQFTRLSALLSMKKEHLYQNYLISLLTQPLLVPKPKMINLDRMVCILET